MALAVVMAALPSCAVGSTTAWVTGTPVLTPAPSAVPAFSRPGGAGPCLRPRLERHEDGTSYGVVTVDPDPLDATLMWLPSVNSGRCNAQMTSLAVSAATRLAHDERSAPTLPAGRYNCPADDGTAVIAYLSYAHQRDAEVVTIALSGCAFITASERAPRRQTAALRHDLRAAAPPDWIHSLEHR